MATSIQHSVGWINCLQNLESQIISLQMLGVAVEQCHELWRGCAVGSAAAVPLVDWGSHP